MAFSAIQTRPSHSSRGRFSTSPLNKLSAAWQCIFIKPGITILPFAPIIFFAVSFFAADVLEHSKAVILPLLTAMTPFSIIEWFPSHVTIKASVIKMSSIIIPPQTC